MYYYYFTKKNSKYTSNKYLQLLNDVYKIFNYSIDNDLDKYLKSSSKKIIVCCTQSIHKLYEKISNKHITVWFDEAHWGVEEWVNHLKDNLQFQFWLLDNSSIQYRIFTSASPNKDIILKNSDIFGKLYSPIKVKELIDLKWLSSIRVCVYSENKEMVDTISYIIKDFNEKKKKYGFSFYNKQQNAFHLFYRHYILYK